MYIIRHVPLSPPFLTDSALLFKIVSDQSYEDVQNLAKLN